LFFALGFEFAELGLELLEGGSLALLVPGGGGGGVLLLG